MKNQNDRGPEVVHFKCDDCKSEWVDVIRDSQSPSSEVCYCGAAVQSEKASTEQFDNLKFKPTPLGYIPLGMPNSEVSKLNQQIAMLKNELRELNRDAMFCPSCACQSCYNEQQRRVREDSWA